MARYRFTGFKHPDELAGGTPIVVGEEVNLTSEAVDANRRLIDEGLLIELEKPSSSKPKNRRKEESDK